MSYDQQLSKRSSLSLSTKNTKTSPPPSPRLAMTRRLSIEETLHLADTARRKSSDKFVREDLRLKLCHTNFLEMLLQDIAATEEQLRKESPPPSPTREVVKAVGEGIVWAQQTVTVRTETRAERVDEYGFAYEDDGEEDLGGLALCRTPTRLPRR